MIYLLFLVVAIFVYVSLRYKWYLKDIDFSYPRILMYHMVSEHLPKNSSKYNRLRVKPKVFEKQLKWLKRNGWSTYTISELLETTNLPKKSIAITFDDGYRDNFTQAFRLLKKYNMKATVYLVTNRFAGDWASDKESGCEADELNNELMLSDSEVKEMIDSGLIEIGSHTLNHPNLTKLNEKSRLEEICSSKHKIESSFGIDCKSFAYPFGLYCLDDWKMVRDAGYSNAVTTIQGVESLGFQNRFLLKRIMISGRENVWGFILRVRKGRSR